MPEEFDSSYAKEGGFHIGRYRIGSRKWEDYAIDIAHSNVEGAKYIHDTVRNVGSELSSGYREGLEATQARIVAGVGLAMRESGEQLGSALSDLFQSHDENVGLAMDAQTDQITGAISYIRSELEHLGQGLNLGFEFIGKKLDRQIELGHEISSRLASIHNTLLTPAQTSAREFLQIAENHLRHRLYAEAMDFLGRSEQIETVNPSLHVFKGNVYFAQPEFLDLNAAKKEFEIAIKYAEALKKDLPFNVWWQVRDQGYLGLAKVAFVSSGDERLAGNIEFADTLMKEALTLASQQPCSFETIYLRATAAVLSGLPDLALATIQDISDQVPRYLVNALCDPHFLPLQAELKKIPEKLHADTKSETFKIDIRLAELKDVQQRAVAIAGLNESLYSGIDKVRQHIDAIDDQIQNVDFKRDHILQNIESQVHWIDGALDAARSETNDVIARLSREIDADPEKTEPILQIAKELSPVDRPKLENGVYFGSFLRAAGMCLVIGSLVSVVLGMPAGCMGHAVKGDLLRGAPGGLPMGTVFHDGFYFCFILTLLVSLVKGLLAMGSEKKKESERNASTLRSHQTMMQRRASDHSDQIHRDQTAYDDRLSVYQHYVLLTQRRDTQQALLTEINSILRRAQKQIA
jgi:hypothetical protein